MKDFTDSLVYSNNLPFPDTTAKVSSGGTATDGSRWTKDFIDDTIGFSQAILNTAGLTPSGTSETATDSQQLEGIIKICGETIVSEGWVCLAANVTKSVGVVTGNRVSDPVRYVITDTRYTKRIIFELSYMNYETDTYVGLPITIISCNETGTEFYDIPNEFAFFDIGIRRYFSSPGGGSYDKDLYAEKSYSKSLQLSTINVRNLDTTLKNFFSNDTLTIHAIVLSGNEYLL